MTRQRTIGLLTAAALVVPGAALAATVPQGPPDHVLELAHGAAAEARGLALGLLDDVEDEEPPRGRGSAAFVERHAALAAAHSQHPGNASAVHAALAGLDGSPSTAGKPDGDGVLPPGQARKGDAAALRGARARFAEGWPGRGLGRGNGGGGGGD